MRLRPPNSFYFTKWYRAWCNWNEFWKLYNAWQRLDELERLIEWATRKRLGVKHYYKRLHRYQERRISSLHMDAPQRSVWARRLYHVWKMIRPAQKYRQGSASRYVSKNL